jgi:hypothetical protein
MIIWDYIFYKRKRDELEAIKVYDHAYAGPGTCTIQQRKCS